MLPASHLLTAAVALLLGGAVGFVLGRRQPVPLPPSPVPEAPPERCLLEPVDTESMAFCRPSCEELQSQLIRQVAHALRNPLAGILMGTELLEEEDDPVHIRRALLRITEQGLQIKDLIDQIQQAMAVQACQFRLELEALDLGEALGEALEAFQSRATAKGQVLVLEAAPRTLVIADRSFLQGILRELLGNAVKFSAKGSTIRVSILRREEGLRVRIQDGGPGVRAAEREQLFQPFRRLGAVPTGGESGLGLGLWTAWNMARTLGGDVSECSDGTPGGGGCFALDLLEAVYTSTRTA